MPPHGGLRNNMAIHRASRWPVASRMTAGTLHFKNLYNNTFAYTETQKKVANASATAILASTSLSASVATTVTTGLTDPDVPRALSVTVGGTASSVNTGQVVVTGTNVEGKTITESFIMTIATTGTINGTKAFLTVTQVSAPKQAGSGVTITVGTRNILGLNHRLFKNNTTAKVYYASSVGNPTTLTLDTAPTITASAETIEANTITPVTAPDGAKFFIFAYAYDNWSDGSSVNDNPEYSTTTSTSSTSSSTSTTTITTSTSSTSVSTSSTSVSTSSTSSSTSSTSTSTTTAP